tara:strand:+ start:1186 stop:3147 length:1962 start_codon:yes stop_codon:yes gene_type:complete
MADAKIISYGKDIGAGTTVIPDNQVAVNVESVDGKDYVEINTTDSAEKLILAGGGATVELGGASSKTATGGASAMGAEGGSLTISTGDSTETAGHADADDLVVESDGNAGINIISGSGSGTTNYGALLFGRENGVWRGGFNYQHGDANDYLQVWTAGALALKIDKDKKISTGGETAALCGNSGIHIKTSDVSHSQVHPDWDDLVIESASGSRVGITLMSNADGKGGVYFTDPDSQEAGGIAYDHILNEFQFKANAADSLKIKTTGIELKNSTHSNGDGDRKRTIAWGGEKADGTVTTLSELSCQHPTSADDFHSEILWQVNANGGATTLVDFMQAQGSDGSSTRETITLGFLAGSSASGLGNTIVGYNAGGNAESNMTVVGRNAGQVASSSCTYIGTSAGQLCSGDNNVAVGQTSLAASCGALQCTAVGYESLSALTAAVESNSGLGYRSGLALTSGQQCTFLGATADTSDVDGNNQTAIGFGAVTDAAHQVRLGNTSVSDIDGQVALTATSDSRVKADVRDLDLGLSFINALRPVSFTRVHPADWPEEIRDNRYKKGRTVTDADGNETVVSTENFDVETQQPIKEEFDSTTRSDGLIAQEVKAVCENLGVEFNGIKQNKNGKMGIQYSLLVAPLIKAVQELTARIEVLENGD